MHNDLNILFEDNHCLAVAKPAPLLTQGVPPGIITLESMVKAYIKEKYHKAGNVYLGIPHRLDRPERSRGISTGGPKGNRDP
jgi:23S rRNA pseudouridine1911/1915/1917 synthase